MIELIPLLLLTAAIVLALVLVNAGYAIVIRDTWNERRSRVTEPDATDRLHEAVRDIKRARTGIPAHFRDSHIKAHMTGQEQPCRVCAPFRGRLYAYGDRGAPHLPVEGCEHPRGCTCEYV